MILSHIFTGILRMSLIAALVILAVFALNWLLKRLKAPALLVCALWLVVLARLLLPISFSSAFSLLAAPPLQQPLHMLESFAAPAEFTAPSQPPQEGLAPLKNIYANTAGDPALYTPVDAAAGLISGLQGLDILALLWAGGAVCLLLYGVVSYLLLKHRLHTATLAEGNIYELEHINSPFVCGLLKPRIYLPLNLDTAEKAYIILHERIHIRRRDYLLKPLWYMACCLHWFNPLSWLAFKQMGRDMELSCDEAVLRQLGSSIKADYSGSLLALASQRQSWGFSPLAFGENNTRERVRRVLEYKKPALWLALVAGLAVVICAVVLLANPRPQVEIAEEKGSEAAIRLPQDVKAATLSSYSEGEMSVPVYLSYISQEQELSGLCQMLASGEPQADIPYNDSAPTDNYLRIILSAADETSMGNNAIYFVYEQEGRFFVEQPYICLLEISEETYTALQDTYVVANRNWTQRNTQGLFTGMPYGPYSFMRQGDYLTAARRYLKNAQEIELAERMAENHRQATATWPSLSWDDIPQDDLYRLSISHQDGSGTDWYFIYRYQEQLFMQHDYNGQRSLVDEDLFVQMQALLTEEDVLSTQRETLERGIWNTSEILLLRQALLIQGREDALPPDKLYEQLGMGEYMPLAEDALIYEPTYGTVANFREGVICLPPRLKNSEFADEDLNVSGYCLSATFHLSPQNQLSVMEIYCLNVNNTYKLAEAGFYTMTGGSYSPSYTRQPYFDQPQQDKMMPYFSAPMQQLQNMEEYDEAAVKAEIERLLWQYMAISAR